jgi:hypothetical protein
MRRGVWVVLGLMGAAPGGALAQGAQQQQGSSHGAVQQQGVASTAVTPEQAGTASPEDNSGIVLEVPACGVRFPGILGAQRSQALQARSGTGGSGLNPSRPVGPSSPNEEIFVGAVRAATPDRLLIQGPSLRVYEFGLGARTRIVGPNGAAFPLQALRKGELVRTVTRPGDFENQVITLQVLGRTQSPSR